MFLAFFSLLFSFPEIPTVSGELCSINDPDFLEIRYQEKIPICRRNVSSWKKHKICDRDIGYNENWERYLSQFTIDHIIPLSIGGSNSEENLWCQHRSLSVTSTEFEVYLQLKRNLIRQKEAIQKIIEVKYKK